MHLLLCPQSFRYKYKSLRIGNSRRKELEILDEKRSICLATDLLPNKNILVSVNGVQLQSHITASMNPALDEGCQINLHSFNQKISKINYL